MSALDLPEGYTLRGYQRLAPATLAKRPLSLWVGDLRRLVERGGVERWLTPTEAGFGSDAGTVGALHARGALLIADRGRGKLYRVTAKGERAARGLDR